MPETSKHLNEKEVIKFLLSAFFFYFFFNSGS
jgi:hypothetical protein